MQTLTPADASATFFGNSVAFNEHATWLVVGSPASNDNAGAGQVSVFSCSNIGGPGGGCSSEQALTFQPQCVLSKCHAGNRVALASGADVLAVAAPNMPLQSNTNAVDAGGVFLFAYSSAANRWLRVSFVPPVVVRYEGAGMGCRRSCLPHPCSPASAAGHPRAKGAVRRIRRALSGCVHPRRRSAGVAGERRELRDDL